MIDTLCSFGFVKCSEREREEEIVCIQRRSLNNKSVAVWYNTIYLHYNGAVFELGDNYLDNLGLVLIKIY